MGVFLILDGIIRRKRSLPHARGGVSGNRVRGITPTPSSPRSWGCFHGDQNLRSRACVFPTLVGVFPFGLTTKAESVGSSPRSWGCFRAHQQGGQTSCVFPTLVGVFLGDQLCDLCHYRLPHARGGVSDVVINVAAILKSSPRSWGCFHHGGFRVVLVYVFPTLVGVFLTLKDKRQLSLGLPHARGGVSRA